MARAIAGLSEDQFMCSICLDVFTEPVSTPCGHNFCSACINKYWDAKEQRKCPLCNENFNRGLKLCVNTGFKEVVENFKTHLELVDNDSPVKPAEVPCDCCVGNKFPASKTCLVCLTSYCETHLEPHQRVATLKSHKLTNPVKNLEDKICKEHNRILELFCKNDLTRVCALCAEHSSHDTVPLEEAYVDQRAQMVEKKAGITGKRGKKATKTKVAAQTRKKGKGEALANNVEAHYVAVPNVAFHREGPHQPNTYSRLPAHLDISEGKFYYEVAIRGKISFFLGLVRESVLQKSFPLNTRNGNWFIKVENTNCTVLHNVPLNLLLTRKPERITVFVDYDNRLVSFYDDNANLIYTFTDCKFKRERVFLFYCPAEDTRRAEGLQVIDVLLAFIFLMVIVAIFKLAS